MKEQLSHPITAIHEQDEASPRFLDVTQDYAISVDLDKGHWLNTKHSPGSLTVTGYTAAEYQADSLLWFHIIHEADRLAVLCQLCEVLHGSTPKPVDFRIHHKDGRLLWLRNRSFPRKDFQGSLVGYDGVLCDITELKQAKDAQFGEPRGIPLVK